ncbi:hypothetical protein SSX86_026097 [Deinandra increscens subsp. villosa]|uniref:Cytochrome b5 heme-binding domain-containing protein n=1 Tax=Deinandra increscens subsp. villosa TaxID=3103831 RepID=A0AAP0GLZ2_9ASTR
MSRPRTCFLVDAFWMALVSDVRWWPPMFVIAIVDRALVTDDVSPLTSSSILSNIPASELRIKVEGAMELMVITLIIGFLLSLLLLAPRFFKSDQTKKVQHSDANSKILKAYNKAEVSLHNKRTDCWIIIKDKVYDVTPYVEEHPGGDAILAHAGDDSTEGFFGPQHATRVFDIIDDFYIGELEK